MSLEVLQSGATKCCKELFCQTHFQ